MAQKNGTRRRSGEWALMARGILALLGKTIDLMPFVEADRADEALKNRDFAAQTPQQLRQWRREYQETIAERLRLLRQNIFWSLPCSCRRWWLVWHFRVWSPCLPNSPRGSVACPYSVSRGPLSRGSDGLGRRGRVIQ